MQQAIGKILRHGYESKDPTKPSHVGNRRDLERELGDVMAEVDRMCIAGDIDRYAINGRRSVRGVAALKYAHHQGHK